ncbi:MAG TPA: DUF6789 family protein [Roseiflexaceae bacterium]|nr:DUF6789 family protein [Roseiflexaceae bacterium]
MSLTTPSTFKTRPAVSPLPDVMGLGGALAGLAGGLAMAIVAAIISASMGQDIWHESKRIAAIVYGPAALAAPGFDLGPVLVGSLIHLLVSAVLGAIFGIVTRRWLGLTSDFGTPVLAGLIYGMMIWLVAYFIVLPVLNPALLEVYAPAFIIQHVVYGIVTGLVYMWLRPQPYES